MNWYYAVGLEQRGPVDDTEFQRLVAAGVIRDDTLVWHEGMAQWQAYATVRAAPAGASMPPAPLVPAVDPELARKVARDKVNGPAIGLLVTAIIGLLFSLLTVILNVSGVDFTPPEMRGDPQVAKLMESLRGTLGLVDAGLKIAAGIVVVMGALRMRRLESFGLSIAAAIIALVPCFSPCCLIGLPIGIWALVVLNQPDVKVHFR